ncbi:hypothetical protein M422DRAFT_49329 [Sphaerobolus stellatus SS14]|uniref:F-box domain-containing protein n=1 Tax=Sphaerobolus stellatus (strain SS14) TaxID=990650 RepID=A0A0C9VFH6_SPHS4|nr:hypothetical protein M422DRAFT_49329 [Sphaerobolus stellatus SS14]
MSSFHDIPTEILQHIFTLCMDPPEIYESVYCWDLIADSFTTRDSIVLVSKTWKALAESTPGLWTLIKVPKGDWSSEKNLFLAQTSLLRSGSLPINLILVKPNSISEAFLQLLKSNFSRCRTLYMNLDRIGNTHDVWLKLEDLLPSPTIELPNLRSLIFFHSYEVANPQPTSSVHASNLRTLGLGSNAVSILGSLTAETLHALHTLDIGHPAGLFDLRIFKNCPNLRHILWRSTYPTIGTAPGFTHVPGDFPIVLPHLTNLSFVDVSWEFKPMWINDFFKTPGIKHLSYMRQHPFDDELPIVSINDFSSSNTLTTMRLTQFTMTGISQGLGQSIAPFPNLRTLSINDSKIYGAFFDSLNATTGEDGTPIMGGLSNFNIDRCNFSVTAMENWLHKRASSHLSLPQIQIKCWDAQHLEVKKLAERYTNIGINPIIAIWNRAEHPRMIRFKPFNG